MHELITYALTNMGSVGQFVVSKLTICLSHVVVRLLCMIES